MSHWSDYLYDHLPLVLSCRVDSSSDCSSSASSSSSSGQETKRHMDIDTPQQQQQQHKTVNSQTLAQLKAWYTQNESKDAPLMQASQQTEWMKSWLKHAASHPEQKKVVMALGRLLFLPPQ